MSWDWQLDGWIVVVGMLGAVAASLLGNFLILRRMSMLGDAISHAVLPGLAVAFLLSESRSSLPMFVGAIVVGIGTAFFTEWIRAVGRVDEGASMGVVFTSLFALGLVIIVQTADRVDLDPGCVLYGAIELTPLETVSVAGFEVPRAAVVNAVLLIINGLFVGAFYKELTFSSFDPALATSLGFHARGLHYGLMILVAVTAVASFETVGNILLVAMLVVPPATAFLLTRHLPVMIGISAVVAAVSAAGGHLAAISIPGWFGFRSTTTAGMMAVIAGILFLFAMLFAPEQGVLVRYVRQRLLSLKILADDVIALLYRLAEVDPEQQVTVEKIRSWLLADPLSLWLVVRSLRRRGWLHRAGAQLHLTAAGTTAGQQLVRSHRLWEQYLVTKAGLSPDRIHDKAERFEHFTDSEMRDQLQSVTAAPAVDPHGRKIPAEE